MKVLFIYLSILFLSLSGIARGAIGDESILPKKDLRKFGDLNNQTIKLKNNWGIVWDKLVENQDDIYEGGLQIVDLSNNWTGYRPKKSGIGSYGFATYCITLVTDPGFTKPGIKIPPLHSAAKVIVNGEIYLEIGKVAKSQEGTVPEYESKIIGLKPSHDGVYHIIIQVSNFHYRRGGLVNAPEFGSMDALTKKTRNSSYLILFLFGAFTMMTIYLMSFYFHIKKTPLLYFGLLCLTLAIRLLIMNDAIINEFIAIPWHWIIRIDYVTFYMGSLLFILFVCSLFKNIVDRQVFRISLFIILLFNIAVLVTMPAFFNYTAIPFQIFIVAISLYFLFKIGKRAIAGDFTARIFFIGISIFYLTILNDILSINDLIPTGDLFHVGLLFLILSMAVILPFYFSKVYKRVNLLKNELSVQNAELKDINSELDRLIYIVSHDLKSPLSSLLGLIDIAKKENIDEKLDDIFRLQEKSVKNLRSFIKDILDYSKNSNTEFVAKPVDFNFLINELLDGIAYEKNYANVAITLNISQNEAFATDLFRLRIILNNLMSNAYKFHDQKKSAPGIAIFIKVVNGLAMIEIKDNGIGIAEDQLKKVFEIFYRADNANVEGTGLGLYLVKECVDALGGKISIDSAVNEGTCVLIEIPHYQISNAKDTSLLKENEAKQNTLHVKFKNLKNGKKESEVTPL